jgi:polyisoprenoid-binding protein YceI
VDAIHSQLFVGVRHMGVANLRAKFPKIAGKLEVDPADPLRSTFEFEADVRAVTTGHPPQEDFMRSENWLDAENHPTLTFRSTAIEPGDGAHYVVRGDLTLRGVTKPVEIPLEYHGVVSDPWGLRAGFTSRFTVNRRDFGITWNREFDWGPMAGYDLEVSLDIELSHPDESLAQKPRS